MGIPVGEARDPPLCPPPSVTQSLGICYLKKCSNHQDCSSDEACCFNGCIHSCIKPMDQPAGKQRIVFTLQHVALGFVKLFSMMVNEWREVEEGGKKRNLIGSSFRAFLQSPMLWDWWKLKWLVLMVIYYISFALSFYSSSLLLFF